MKAKYALSAPVVALLFSCATSPANNRAAQVLTEVRAEHAKALVADDAKSVVKPIFEPDYQASFAKDVCHEQGKAGPLSSPACKAKFLEMFYARLHKAYPFGMTALDEGCKTDPVACGEPSYQEELAIQGHNKFIREHLAQAEKAVEEWRDGALAEEDARTAMNLSAAGAALARQPAAPAFCTQQTLGGGLSTLQCN
jgi:hypothetical protein